MMSTSAPKLDRDRSDSPARNRPFMALLVASVGLFFGFSLLVSVVPLWVVDRGAGELAAGASTGVFMAATVLAQLLMAGLVRRFGYRAMSIAGALLLGPSAALLPIATAWQAVLVISFVRGLGFGIVTVCGSALIAELLPRGALGRGSGLYGLSVGVPLLVGLPASTWVAQNVSFPLLFFAGAALPALAIVPLLAVPGSRGEEVPDERAVRESTSVVWRPWLVMLSGSIAFGAMVTFLPLVFVESPVAGSAALLLMSAGALGTRFAAGVWGDRWALSGRLLLFGLILTAAGLLGFAVATEFSSTVAIVLGVAGVALYGAGFGMVQNDSLVLMFGRVPAARASVAWNVAFDAGQGAGAVVVGALLAFTGYGTAFAVLGVFVLLLAPVARRAR